MITGALVVAAAAWLAVVAIRPTRPKNVILISMDTVRPDHLGCYGYHRSTSPGVDAYAESGVVFTNCTSPSSWTTPAHLSILTGFEPATHGCIYYKHPGRLNQNYQTMAKIFTRRGFRTAAFTGGGFAGSRHGFDIGFEKFVEKGLRFRTKMKSVRKWLEKIGDQPFFMFLHGFDAHRPYAPPKKFRKLFSSGYQGNYNIRKFGPGKPRPIPVDLEYVISQYDGEIANVDALLTKFLKRLERRGLLKDTLVIITSDHGDEFYEHGSCDHIRTLHDELIRAVWIMFGPGIPSMRIDHHVGTIDILPTVLDLFGFEEDIPFQGTSRLAMLAGEAPTEDALIYSFTGKGTYAHRHYSSVRSSKWKLIADLPGGHKNKSCPHCRSDEPEGDNIQLFDLTADPLEQRNVAGEHPAVVEALYDRLVERIAESKSLGLGVETPGAASEEYDKTLRTLGYVDD